MNINMKYNELIKESKIWDIKQPKHKKIIKKYIIIVFLLGEKI